MQNAPHRYPVGVQVFEDIRTRGYLYADKTGYIWDMIQMGGKYRFLSRPRRFGKTLLVSTMEAYFRGRKDLFRGLAIERLDAREVWPEHPVIRLDLSTVKSATEEGLARDLDQALRRVEEAYGRDPEVEGWGPRLDDLIRRAATTPAGANGVVVLVDEYDAPLLNVMHDPVLLERFREAMRELYSPLKANEANLAFLFITGITKFSQLSIFSELNNLANISMEPRFGGVCGITAEELDGPLAPDVEYLAESLGLTVEECRAALKERYDGYRFTEAPAEIYNPFSLVMALDYRRLGSYWFGSGTPTSLVAMLKSAGTVPEDLEGIALPSQAFDAPTEGMADPVAFMYQGGYLTIKDYDPRFEAYTLGIPNREVERGLFDALLPAVTGTTPVATGGMLTRLSMAIAADDMDAALALLRSFLASIPYDLAPRREKDFQAVLYLVLKLIGAHIETEVRTSAGRVDAVVRGDRSLYVVELKYRRAGEASPTSADALAQIDSRGYALAWQADGTPVVKVGACYSEDARTLDEDWVIQEA